MRNLKRTLSLVLAAAMLIGMMVVSASAVEFKDQADISYDEAVSVMAEMGILEGNNGSFDPTGILTREQAAKIITYVVMGKEKAEKLAASSTFDDVKATDWAAKYIAYCSAKNIIAGDGTGKFNPKGELTGFAFGKMLLVALGFDPAACGLTGGNWEINTSTLLAAEKLDAGLESVVLGSSMTREQAAQMALNAMKWSPNGFVYRVTEGTGLTLKNYDFDSEGVALAYFAASTDANKVYVGKTTAASDTMLKKVHSITANDSAVDAFGRPGTSYSKTGWDAPLFFADEPVLTYTTAVTGGKLYSDLGKVTPTTLTVTLDGKPCNADTVTAVKGVITSGNVNELKSGGSAALTGNGVQTEVYKIADGSYAIVIVNTYVGTIGGWTAAKTDANGDVTAKEYVNVTVGTVKPGTLNSTGKFETTDFAKADATASTVVLYTAAYDGTSNYNVKSVVAAEKVENVGVTAYKTGIGAYVTAGGNQYKYSFKEISGNSYTMDGVATYTLFLDGNGYVISDKVYTASASTDYYYVAARGNATQIEFGSKYSVSYKLIGMDGTATVVKQLEDDGNHDINANSIVTFTDDSVNAGYVKLSAKTAVDTTKGYQAPSSISSLNKTTPVIGTNVVANADTVFVLMTAADTWKVFTGISAIPSYTSLSATAYAYVGSDGYADVVYMDVSGGTPSTSVADNLVFILANESADARYDATNKVTYYAYPAIVNGEVTEIFAEGNKLTTDGTNKISVNAGLIKVTRYNGKGYIDRVSTISATGVYAKVNADNDAAITYSAPVLNLAGATYLTSESTVVYYYNTTTKTLTVGTPADLVGTQGADDTCSVIYTSASDSTVATIFYYGTIAK